LQSIRRRWAVIDALLQARTVLAEQFSQLDYQVHRAARADKRGRLLTTVPGVGSIVALTFASAILAGSNRPRGGADLARLAEAGVGA